MAFLVQKNQEIDSLKIKDHPLADSQALAIFDRRVAVPSAHHLGSADRLLSRGQEGRHWSAGGYGEID